MLTVSDLELYFTGGAKMKTSAVYTPLEIYYWIVKEDISLPEENK